MVGLLDGGLASTFATVFGTYFLDGMLHRATRDDSSPGGNVAISWTDTPIKGQVDQVSEAMRAAAGYTANQQRLIILASGISPDVTTEDEITLGGQRWSIASVETDPARTQFIVRGQAA